MGRVWLFSSVGIVGIFPETAYFIFFKGNFIGCVAFATRAFATPIFVASATPIFVASATPYFRISATQTAATPKILF